MNFAKSKRLKILGASALAFLSTITTLFLLPTSDVDAKAKNKKIQTTFMAKPPTPEPTKTPPTRPKKNVEKGATAETATVPTQQAKPKSVEERIQEDLQRAREARAQNKDVEAFRTACAVANTIKRNRFDQEGANAETFQKYWREAVEIAQTSGDRLQKNNNDQDKPLVFVF